MLVHELNSFSSPSGETLLRLAGILARPHGTGLNGAAAVGANKVVGGVSETPPGAVARGSRRVQRRARRAFLTGIESAREAPRAAPPAGAPKEEASRPGLAGGGRANTMSEKAPLRLVNGS